MIFKTFLLILFMAASLFPSETRILKRSSQVEPESLDPHKILGFYESQIIHDLFEGLVSYDEYGKLVPALAERWEIGDDGTEYKFYLRDSRWSDGNRITAHDVVFSFRRLLDPSTAAPSAFMFYPIKNALEINSGKLRDPNLLGVTAQSRNVVIIRLKSPTSYFLDLLAHRAAVILSRRLLGNTQADWATPEKMITNGPYTLSEWIPLSYISLQKSQTYWDKDQVNIEKVHYYPIEDKNQEFQRFKTQAIDITTDIPTDQNIIAKTQMKDAYHEHPALLLYFLGFNMSKPLMKNNPKLRQALSIALNRELLIKSILKDSEIPAYSIVPNGIEGYDIEELGFKSLSLEQKIQKARQLYQEAGFSETKPLTLEILYNSDSGHKKNLIAIIGMWRDAFGPNINITLKEVEWKVYLQARNSGDFSIARAGWNGDYPHPSAFLEMFSSRSTSQNPCKYHNVEFDLLLEKASKANSNKGAFTFFKQAERILIDENIIIPIFHGKRKKLVNPKLEGYKDNTVDIHRSKYLKWRKENND